MIRFKVLFIGHGESVEPVPGRLVLDTGNRLLPGVIDHHQDGAGLDCTATLVTRLPELVLDFVGTRRLEDVEIVVHYMPDFDAVTATFLAATLIETGKQASGAAQLADYALRVDQSTLPVTRHPEDTPYGIYAGIVRLIEAEPPMAPLSNTPYDRSYRMLERGLELMDLLNRAVDAGADLYGEELFAGEHPFAREQEIVREDYQRYMADLLRGQIYSVVLPGQEDGASEEVDLLVVKDPAASMFKVWARQDQLHSQQRRGFTMLTVQYGDSRFVVSVDPRAAVSLRGLGAALDRAETAKREMLGMERTGPPRPGYDNSDPWYDGRAAIHNFTIVDAPRSGTVLDADEVLEIVLHPERWAHPVAGDELHHGGHGGHGGNSG